MLNALLNSLTEQHSELHLKNPVITSLLLAAGACERDLRGLPVRGYFSIGCLWLENFRHNTNPER